MADDEKSVAAVYVGFGTFKNALERLSSGIPNRIDKSAFPGQSWGVIAQLLTGLRFLGLIDDQGNPSPRLSDVAAPDEDERKRQLDKLLRERYADVFALDLTRATPAQLSEVIGAYGVSGDTREKAVRFFLGAVNYLGIPVSSLLKLKSAANGGRTRKKGSSKKTKVVIPEQPPAPPVVQTAGTSKSITLKGGETLTLSVTADFFAMDPGDLDFVFRLHREMLKYEQGILSGQSQTDPGGEE